MARPLIANVDLDAIRQNYLLAKSLCPTSKAFAVIKANAYGHGAVPVALALDDIVDAFAVAAIEEALELRDAGVNKPIMLLEGVFEAKEWPLCHQYNFWCAIENPMQLEGLLAFNKPIEKVFVKVDTGMHRLGVAPEQAAGYVERLRTSGIVEDILLMSHFACADELEGNHTLEQLACLETVRRQIGEAIEVSVANSAALLKWPIPTGGWIRPGIMLYGISPFVDVSAHELGLRPAMSLTSKVISVRQLAAGDKVGYAYSYSVQRPSTIATIAVGYGDGYPRHAVNGTSVVVNGVRCPLAGRVSMDMITVDVTDLPSTHIGDMVELWGDSLPVEEVAASASTIGYELVTRMTSRPHYVYVKGLR